MELIALIVALAGAGLGALAAYLLGRRGLIGRTAAVEAEVARRAAEAEARNKELLLEAKEEAIRLRSGAEAEARQQREEIKAEQGRLRGREEALDRKIETVETRERRTVDREQQIEHRSRELEELRAGELRELERIANLTRDEAREQIIGRVEIEMRDEASRRARQIVESSRATADEEARRLITLAVQRLAGEHIAETTVTAVPIPSEEMKGRIIGKEGRNIRALEAATGVDLIIDETPDAVMVSGFDPVRREIASIALAKLVQDGRIHPARIEEVVAKVTTEVEGGMAQAGEAAALEAGVHGLHPELIKLLGKLKYRTSYGQNQLRHSVEVAQIARMLADELAADAQVAARGALLHDIGKVMSHDVEGPHNAISADLVRHFGESPRVAEVILDHHEDAAEPPSLEAAIVQAADAISSSRPGTRHETVERYMKRLEALEQVANSFPGVQRSFAIQAGREMRIIVRPDQIDDLASIRLARDIAKRIESSMQYPGQVKVTVVRETRAFDVAH